ncbi:MAG TPA: NAD-dependent epimerase/dehydratase family protein [Kofleriaceae bacterium]|nr:NAD-dependent epimerase/dehydratase family protein [Kofleriaceae bacterium]
MPVTHPSSSSPVVLVTGGAGFIGSHTVDRLVADRCKVVVLDDLRTGKRSNLAGHGSLCFADGSPVELVVADVSHGLFAPLAPITAVHGPVSHIVHLAAQVSVAHSLANPLVDVQVNYVGTVQVLEYARATGVRKVVFASSAAVYGEPGGEPTAEDAPCRPLSPYGVDKLASEHMLRAYASVHRVASTPLRFFNVYGPRQDPTSPYSGVISIFADRARAGRPITFFGDGEQTRDCVYVEDVARVIVAALRTDGGDGSAINVGTGRETRVRDLAETIVSLAGSSSTIQHAEARAGEIVKSVARVDRARAMLDFTAKTALRDGLAATLGLGR